MKLVLALLAAIALTVPARAVDVPTCSEVRHRAQDFTWAQIRVMAKRHKLTAAQWAQIEMCLKDKKK